MSIFKAMTKAYFFPYVDPLFIDPFRLSLVKAEYAGHSLAYRHCQQLMVFSGST